MKRILRIGPVAVLAFAAACASGNPGPGTPGGQTQPSLTGSEPFVMNRGMPYSEADVHFMTGMISHHAQAVLIAGWAPSHGASAAVQRLCERIVVGQRDEIALMRTWLADRNETVPNADGTGGHVMPGMSGPMLMPGMLTAVQLAELDAARGVDFDRLFLTYMIMHHEGALTMVDDLFNSYGAAQDEVVFRFASDVWADQSTEIDRMQLMLDALPAGGRVPDMP